MEHLINTGLISSSLILIATSFIYVVNNINTKEIERKLMSNFQRIKYSLSLSLVLAFFLAISTTIWTAIKNGELEYHTALATFIVTFILLIVVLIIVEIFFIFIFRNRKYEITLMDGSEWEIIKTINGKALLLKKGDEYKIINDYYNFTIKVSK